MRIVDPTHGVASDPDVGPLAPRATATGLCLFSNSKPGATELLTGIGRLLEAEHAVRDIGFVAKSNAAAAAQTDTVDHLAARYRAAVVAIGD